MELTTGNVSTVATWSAIIVMIIEVLLKHFGIEIPHDTIVLFVTGIVTFIIAVWSSKNPNTLNILGNGVNNDIISEEETDEGC